MESCPCGSRIAYKDCSLPYIKMLDLASSAPSTNTVLIDWSKRFAPPISIAFHDKAITFVYRISRYLDAVMDSFMEKGYPGRYRDQEEGDERHFYPLTLLPAGGPVVRWGGKEE